MENINRRQLLSRLGKGLGGLLVMTNTSLMTACATPEPRPFLAGNIVTAPIGCTELLQRDPRGDC